MMESSLLVNNKFIGQANAKTKLKRPKAWHDNC